MTLERIEEHAHEFDQVLKIQFTTNVRNFSDSHKYHVHIPLSTFKQIEWLKNQVRNVNLNNKCDKIFKHM